MVDMFSPKLNLWRRALRFEDSARYSRPAVPSKRAVFLMETRISPELFQNANLITLHAGIQRVVDKLGESIAGG